MYLKIIFRLALILLLIAPSWAGAAIWDKNARIENFDRIFVVITDGATGGCWTNIRTASQYAEDKLLLAGAKVELDHGRQGYGFAVEGVTFAIIINASRSGGLCNGQIDIELSAIDFGNQIKHAYAKVEYSRFGKRFAFLENSNNAVLNAIEEAIKEWTDQRK